MIEHMILNLEGTIIPVTGEPILRDGFENFIGKYNDKKISIFSRMPKELAREKLMETGFDGEYNLYGSKSYIRTVYAGQAIEGMGEIEAFNHTEKVLGNLAKGKEVETKGYALVPYLLSAISDAKTSKDKTVLISNHPDDIGEVSWKSLKYGFQIPHFIKDENNFSFDQINLDSFRLGWNKFLTGKNLKVF